MALQIEHLQEDPRIQYELVDGVFYRYTGPAGDVSLPVPCEEVDGELYPYAEEGAPMVQGDLHSKIVRDWENMTTGLLLDWPDVGIFSDVYLYWHKGQRKPYAPDLYVLPRVRKLKRRQGSVHEWKEPSKSVFVLEVLSTSNDREDPEKRLRDYQDKGKIQEYLICDPRRLPIQMYGHRLEQGVYVPIEPDEHGRIWSEQLKGWFGISEDGQVQVWDKVETPMPRYEDALRRLKREMRRAEAEARRADEEARRADQEARKVAAEACRADQEARRAEAAEARINELEAALNRLQHNGATGSAGE